MVWIVVVAIESIHEDVESTYAVVDVVVFATASIMAEIGDFIVGLMVAVFLLCEPILQGINKFPSYAHGSSICFPGLNLPLQDSIIFFLG